MGGSSWGNLVNQLKVPQFLNHKNTFQEEKNKAMITTETMPEAESNGFVRTLNNMGFMTSTLDEYSTEFTRFAAKAPGPALDIGAAYGIATIPAIRNGARVIANDIDARHLEILKQRLTEREQQQLTLMPGRFPEELTIAENSLGAILVARVLHFFTGDMVEKTASIAASWLKKGGKIFVVAETPYLKNFQSFIPIYENRMSNGNKWPGFIDDVMAVAPERGQFLPKQMHLLDPNVLTRTFANAGFQIEKCSMIQRLDFPPDLQWDGRESVGIIAKKI